MVISAYQRWGGSRIGAVRSGLELFTQQSGLRSGWEQKNLKDAALWKGAEQP